MSRNYDVDKISIKNLLSDIDQERISFPEIQRPFVWDAKLVSELIDSIFKGFPIGYIITSTDPEMIQKDGTKADGRTSVIDGQQRITALKASILGEKVVNKYFKQIRIVTAFNPFPNVGKDEPRFQTLTPAIEKDVRWIPDISKILNGTRPEVNAIIEEYARKNPDKDMSEIDNKITELESLKDQEIGIIRLLSKQLSIEEVNTIFERINSKGVPLNQADFTMSKLAAHKDQGSELRKLIEYFSHLVRDPEYFNHISENDPVFEESGLLDVIGWLKDVRSTTYEPDYSDIIRTSFTYKFKRGKLADLVSLIAGRNFETRSYEEVVADDTVFKLKQAVLDFVKENNFTDFIQIVESTGFIDSKMIGSKNALNYAYAIYLIIRDEGASPGVIKKIVSRWFVMSILTGRYSSSPESAIDRDVKDIERYGVEKVLNQIEESELSEQFWNVALLNDFDKASLQHPYINTFFAAQVFFGDKGFLSDVTLRSIREIKGDIHHTFPYEYLRDNGITDRSLYNQIANFVYMEKSTNISIGKMSPKDYMSIVMKQAESGKLGEKPIGKIIDPDLLRENLRQNCIPEDFENMIVEDFDRYLISRRKLMVMKIEKYYKSL